MVDMATILKPLDIRLVIPGLQIRLSGFFAVAALT
jgi:hypothetical protein